MAFIADDQGNDKRNGNINCTKQKFHDDHARKMLVQQLRMLGNIAVVEIGDPRVKQYIKEESKIKNGEIETVLRHTNCIVHYPVDPEYPERFYKQVQEQQQGKVGKEFFLH